MPEVPTIAEAGVPGYEAIVWIGMLAPAGTPRDIVTKLNGEIGKLVRTDEVKKLIATTGMDADPDTRSSSVPTSRSTTTSGARWCAIRGRRSSRACSAIISRESMNTRDAALAKTRELSHFVGGKACPG